MNEHSLPEDPAQWPADPYALIGIDRTDDGRTVKLAYTRLIRRFKPERYPEQFRRLREAYEIVRERLQWRWTADRDEQDREAAEDEADESDDLGDDPFANPTSQRTSVPEPQIERAARRFADDTPKQSADGPPTTQGPHVERPAVVSRATELEAAWRQAQEGELLAAYERLQAAQRHFGPHRDICIREYWLLKIDPTIDSERSCLDPLTTALTLDRLSGPASELYRRECERHPAEAVGGRLTAILEQNTDASSDALADVLRWRWVAAGQLQAWSIIIADIERFRRTIVDDEQCWARLLLAALDQLAWGLDDEPQKCFQQLLREIKGLQHIHGSLSREFDRLDLLIAVAAGWHQLSRKSTYDPEIAFVIRSSWTQPVVDYRAECSKLIGILVADPIAALRMLDAICRMESAMVVQLGNAIDRYRYHCGRDENVNDFDADLARKRAAQELLSWPEGTYAGVRTKLLAMCLQEGLSPAVVVQLTEELPGCQATAEGELFAPHVETDAALCCVYNAWETFFA